MTKEMLKVTLLFLSVEGILGIKCHEGFNVSLAGLPFYHWAERKCESDSECIIQDIIVNEGDLEVSIRYGGCIKHSYSTLLKCSHLFGEENTGTVEDYFDLMLGMDKKIHDLAVDFSSDPTTHKRLLLSRGGHDKDEFFQGILRFLTKLGYDGKKIKDPLKNFFVEFKQKEYGASFTFDNLIESMKVANEKTKRFSDALSGFLDILYPNMPSEFKFRIAALSGILYPVYSVAGYNVSNRLYESMSNGFELVNNGSTAILSKEKIEAFLHFLTLLQRLIGDFHLGDQKMMYDFNIKTFQMYETAYPDSFVLKDFRKRADILHKYRESTDFLFPCSTFGECWRKHYIELLLVQIHLNRAMNALRLESLIESDQTDILVNAFFNDDVLKSDVEELVQVLLTWSKTSSLNSSGLPFLTLAQHMHRPVTNIANKLRDGTKQKLRRLFTPHSCKDYFCGSDLCNRHDVIEVQKQMLTSQSKDPEHNEL